jgi:ketosteroid isomerase-like protein
MHWCHVFTIRDGRITEFRGYHDTAPMVDAWRS